MVNLKQFMSGLALPSFPPVPSFFSSPSSLHPICVSVYLSSSTYYLSSTYQLSISYHLSIIYFICWSVFMPINHQFLHPLSRFLTHCDAAFGQAKQEFYQSLVAIVLVVLFLWTRFNPDLPCLGLVIFVPPLPKCWGCGHMPPWLASPDFEDSVYLIHQPLKVIVPSLLKVWGRWDMVVLYSWPPIPISQLALVSISVQILFGD